MVCCWKNIGFIAAWPFCICAAICCCMASTAWGSNCITAGWAWPSAVGAGTGAPSLPPVGVKVCAAARAAAGGNPCDFAWTLKKEK